MKKKILLIAILVLASTTSCMTTGGNSNGNTTTRSKKQIEEDYLTNSRYFIENDGAKLIEYIEKDSNLSARDKQPVKRRYKNLLSLLEEIDQLNQ